jgi:uncharacterized membrane protein YeaQ/YmgE (transglycosylase-associated protein family)
MIGFIIALIIEGLILGALARLALPGPDPMSMGQTILVGVGGALVAGIIAYLIWSAAAGFFLAFVCTVGIVYAIRRSRGGTLTRPAPRAGLRR